MTPIQQGFHFPSEFTKHTATWLSWPHKEASWPGKIETIYPIYCEFIKRVAEGEKVNINVVDETMKSKAIVHLQKSGADFANIQFFIHPTNDAWCRDHGPAFLINPVEKKKMIVSDLLEKGEREGLNAAEKDLLITKQEELASLDKTQKNEIPKYLIAEDMLNDLSKTI